MAKFNDMLQDLKASQDIDSDNRERVKEADSFLNIREGQWEDSVSQSWNNRPKYTFDLCNPVVDSVMADMEENDFAIDVLPNGGHATKDIAEKYAGLVRNTENISGARFIYNHAARTMVGTGLSGWRIKQAYRDADSFQQDLLIEGITNFRERVWFDQGAVKPTMEDAEQAWILTEIPLEDYKERWKDGSGMGVSDGGYTQYFNLEKKNGIIVGEWYYKKYIERELVLMSNGQVFEVNENFELVRDELHNKNITVERTRKRKKPVVCHKFFDGSEFLTDKQETVFEFIPIVPVFANFTVFEHKLLYWGCVEKLMDPQRIVNYAESKKITESALKPIEKTWMTVDQAKSDVVKRGLETQNVNNDPIQLYDHVDGQQPPFKPRPNAPDQVLMETAASAGAYIDKAANMYDAKKGIGLSGQSGETVNLLQKKGSSANFKYFKAMEIALTHTARILIKAYPKVYDTTQELRIIKEDGTNETFVAGESIVDEQTKQVVVLNDLSRGQYDVVYKSGPAYYTRQQETVKTILEAGQVNPAIVQIASDILLKNIPAPGMDAVSERLRNQLINSGVIPFSQLTDEEKVEMEKKMAQGNQPSPTEQAQLQLSAAEMQKAQAQTQDILSKIQERDGKLQLQLQKLIADNALKMQELEERRMEKITNLILAQAEQLNTQADTLKKLKEAIGAEAIVSTGGVHTYQKQLGVVSKTQNTQN